MSWNATEQSLIGALRERGTPVAVFFCLLCCCGRATDAATVMPQVRVMFDGTLSGGNTYTLAPGELDVTGTFRKNGGAMIAGGLADIPGNVDASSGFLFSAATLPALTATNWVAEAVLVPDVPLASQPGTFNHFLDVQGDTFFRFNGNGASKIAQFGYWDGATEPTTTTPDLPTNRFSHVALTWNTSTRTLGAFIDGVSQGTVSTGNVFATPSTNVGFGFFARSGFMNRAIDGKLASVAFSTFTGTFSPGFGPGFDFQLDPGDAPSFVLDLVVNAVSGAVSIVNNTLAPVSINGYEVTSNSGSLDVTSNGWRSLSDQDIDPVMGGDGPGETWEEGGNPTSRGFLEGFLLGSSTLGPGQSLSLGRAFDELVNIQDLTFTYRLASQAGVIDGLISYESTSPPPLDGDYNNNGAVDTADYVVWRKNLGSEVTLPNDSTPGFVTPIDYEVWKSNLGNVEGSGSGARVTVLVPEPATVILAAMVAAICRGVRGWKTLTNDRREE